MLLSIRHQTAYAFTGQAAQTVQYLRLSPRPDPCQSIIDWTVRAPGRLTAWNDGYGNSCHCLTLDGAHDGLDVTVGGQVETIETNGITPLAENDLPPEVFLRSTDLTHPAPIILDLIGGIDRQKTKGTLGALHALMGEVHDRLAHVPDETNVPQSAAQALELGQGGCLDHAHIFIAAARAWGIPARYVSGYLYTTHQDGHPLATHAWAEALVDYLGWVSFDPSNRQSATQAYVRLAVAHDYLGAAPVQGFRLRGGHEEMRVKVSLTQA